MSIYRITSEGRPTAFYECDEAGRAVDVYAVKCLGGSSTAKSVYAITGPGPVSLAMHRAPDVIEHIWVLVEDWTEQAKEWPR